MTSPGTHAGGCRALGPQIIASLILASRRGACTLFPMQPCCGLSAPRNALGVHVKRVQRVARGHEQTISVDAAEGEIGAALRQRNVADGLAIRVVHLHTVEVLARP